MRPWSTARRRVSGSAHAFVEVTSRRLEVEPVHPNSASQITRSRSKCWTRRIGTAGHLQFVMYSLCDLGHHCERIARRRRTCRPIR